MRLPEPISGIMSGARNAKYKADRAGSQAKRANSAASRAKDKAGESKKSQAASEASPRPEAPTQVEQAPESGPAPQPEVAPPPELEQSPRSSAAPFAVIGILGAILAVLLGLAVANNSDDRALFALIGVPLGAVLAIMVLISYGSAGLIDQPD